MKIAVLISYVCASMLYLLMGDSTREWGGFNIITQYLTIGSLSLFCIHRSRLLKFERLLLYYVLGFNFSLSILTLPCIWAGSFWINVVVYWCSVLMGIVFICILFYGWIKYKHELGER